MGNKIHSDGAAPPITEAIYLKDMQVDTLDLEAATKTITATAEASGLVNAAYSYTGRFGYAVVTDARIAILNLISALLLTIDSDDGTHDLRARVYIDAQDASHMIFDVTCTTTGAQTAVQNLNATTLATIFNLIKAGDNRTYYIYLWSPGNHSPVISLVDVYTALGASSTGTFGLPVISFTSPVVCELQIRQLNSCGAGTLTSYAFINNVNYYDAGHAITDTGALSITTTSGSSGPGSWTWQILPAAYPFTVWMKGSSATSYYVCADFVFYIKRWN